MASEWLSARQATDLIQAAGYPDSLDTVRRRIDAGKFGEQGKDWYRAESGYRYVTPAAVAEFIRKRRDGEQ
ncbi:hypothetical protein ACWD69_09280 [Micromonospora chokoriensis]